MKHNLETHQGEKSSNSTMAGETLAESRWPVVVNSSQQESDVARMLQQKHKLRCKAYYYDSHFIYDLAPGGALPIWSDRYVPTPSQK